METSNKYVKFGLKIPNRLGKMPENLGEDFFDSRRMWLTKLSNSHILLYHIIMHYIVTVQQIAFYLSFNNPD